MSSNTIPDTPSCLSGAIQVLPYSQVMPRIAGTPEGTTVQVASTKQHDKQAQQFDHMAHFTSPETIHPRATNHRQAPANLPPTTIPSPDRARKGNSGQCFHRHFGVRWKGRGLKSAVMV